MLDRVRPCTAPARATIDPRFRKKIETAVERLIGLLDATEPDHDLEGGDDAEAVNEDGDPLDFGEEQVDAAGSAWGPQHNPKIAAIELSH